MNVAEKPTLRPGDRGTWSIGDPLEPSPDDAMCGTEEAARKNARELSGLDRIVAVWHGSECAFTTGFHITFPFCARARWSAPFAALEIEGDVTEVACEKAGHPAAQANGVGFGALLGVLAPDDSKRVADALLAAIESARIDMVNRHDAMCRQMETNHFYAEQQRVNPQPAYRGY